MTQDSLGKGPVATLEFSQLQEPTVDRSLLTDPTPHEPVHVLSTHRIQSLEAHVNMRSNLESAATAQATVSDWTHTHGPSMDTPTGGRISSGKRLEAALGSLDISGRPHPSLISELQEQSDEDAPEIPVFPVIAACYH